jgi:hypothetical protein
VPSDPLPVGDNLCILVDKVRRTKLDIPLVGSTSVCCSPLIALAFVLVIDRLSQ